MKLTPQALVRADEGEVIIAFVAGVRRELLCRSMPVSLTAAIPVLGSDAKGLRAIALPRT